MSYPWKYLPLFHDNGEWIERPDYMVLAALSVPNQIDMQHIYETMVREGKINPDFHKGGMSKHAQNVRRREIRGSLPDRVLAGSVVFELARLAYATQKPPIVGAARRLTAFNYHRHFPKATRDTINRKVENAFSLFRSTAHLHAVSVCKPQLLEDLEGDKASLRKFLGIARAFEGFIDENVHSKTFKWDPLRVPQQIARVSEINFKPLTDEELAAAKVS